MSQTKQLHSEQYRLAAKEWVDLKAAADLLEESKSAFLSQLKISNNGSSMAEKDMLARGSVTYREYVSSMVAARKAANLAHVKVEWIKMRYWEHQSLNANARSEARL